MKLLRRPARSEPSAATGFAGNRIDRRSEHRGAETLSPPRSPTEGARFYLFRGDAALLTAGNDPLFTVAEAPTLGADAGNDGAARLGGGAPRLAATICPRRRRSTKRGSAARRPPRAGGRRRAFGGAPRRAGAGAQPRQLAHPPRLLLDLRHGDDHHHRRLPARLPELRRGAFSAHRPGGDHARHRRERRRRAALLGRSRALQARACTPASPASWSPARRSRTRCGARRSRNPASASGACATTPASRGPSPPR